jgi:hypothetical protein
VLENFLLRERRDPVIKPLHQIGSSTGFDIKAFKASYDGMLGRSTPNLAVCGSDALAEDIRASCEVLGLEMTVIADDELSPRRYFLTTVEGLSLFKGSGQN